MCVSPLVERGLQHLPNHLDVTELGNLDNDVKMT